MNSRSPNAPKHRVSDFTHVGDILSEILDDLEAEALAAARRRGRLRGPVKRSQRAASQSLDRLEDTRQRIVDLGL